MQSIKTTAFSILFLFLNTILHGQDTVRIKSALATNYFGKNVYLYQDTTNKLSFDQIRKSNHLFKANEFDVPNLGLTSFNNWVKFTLTNDSEYDKIILNIPNPIIDEADLYVISNRHVDSTKYSNHKPLRARKYNHQFYLFDISVNKGESVDCYLLLKSNQQLLAPLSLKNDETVVTSISDSDTRTGLYLGIMLVMLIYNLFIYFTTRDKDYLVYCHYIFWVTLTQATLLGYSHRFLWKDNLWLSQNMVILCGAMSGIVTILFAKSFLHTRRFVYKLDIALNIAIAFYVISIGVLLSGNEVIAFQLVNIAAGSGSVLVMYVAWAVYRKKYASAKYFLLSWSLFFTCIVIFVAKDYNLVPYNMFTVHSVEIGSALEAVILSFALAGKINILKSEKEASQAEALRIAEENAKIVREQNVTLEFKVKERTTALIASNEELNKAIHDLKEAESQLVESEKMASLGQLTAGIAHEINNPINFITSNVKPLKRDVQYLLDTITTIEKTNSSSLSLQEKQKIIEDYKEDIDFDYLKIEIEHLLNGINEGATRTSEIVKGLRIFSRLDEDDLKKADLNEGIDSTLTIVNNLLNNKIQVIKDYGNIPLVECYPGKLNQVFMNIISNAIYAIKKQHPNDLDGSLTIETRHDEKFIYVKIKDNGTGMDEQTKKKIFEPFFTTKDVGEGTGLGMSIVYNTIKKHNGQIHVHSVIGAGTEFIIDLPKL